MRDEELDRLLAVCRISLKEEEKARIKADVEEIISYLGQVAAIDCADLEPAYQPIDVPTRFKDDKVREFKEKELLLKGSKLYKGYVVGPNL